MFAERFRHATAFKKKGKAPSFLLYKKNFIITFTWQLPRVPERQQVFGGVKKVCPSLLLLLYSQGNQLITDTAVVCCNYLPVVSRKMLQFEAKLPRRSFLSVPHKLL